MPNRPITRSARAALGLGRPEHIDTTLGALLRACELGGVDPEKIVVSGIVLCSDDKGTLENPPKTRAQKREYQDELRKGIIRALVIENATAPQRAISFREVRLKGYLPPLAPGHASAALNFLGLNEGLIARTPTRPHGRFPASAGANYMYLLDPPRPGWYVSIDEDGNETRKQYDYKGLSYYTT